MWEYGEEEGRLDHETEQVGEKMEGEEKKEMVDFQEEQEEEEQKQEEEQKEGWGCEQKLKVWLAN